MWTPASSTRGGATATINAALSTCDDAGANTDAAGQCLLVISSPTAGQTKAFATVTLLVGGVSLTRDSDSTTAAIGHGPGGTDEATKDWLGGVCPTGPLGGVGIGGLTNDLFFFGDGNKDANWQSSSPGYVGNVVVNGLLAKLRTSGNFAYAGTISTNAATLAAWQKIVDNNPGQALASYNEVGAGPHRLAELNAAFLQINALPVTPEFESRSAASLDGLNTQNGINQLIVINVTSGFNVKDWLTITGDAGDVFVLRWDTDATFANGYQGQVKFQSGGAIVPGGGLSPGQLHPRRRGHQLVRWRRDAAASVPAGAAARRRDGRSDQRRQGLPRRRLLHRLLADHGQADQSGRRPARPAVRRDGESEQRDLRGRLVHLHHEVQHDFRNQRGPCLSEPRSTASVAARGRGTRAPGEGRRKPALPR